MGASGCDVTLSASAAKQFPFGIECKNVEKLQLWSAWDQAVANAKKTNLFPVLFIKKNRKQPLAVVEAEYFINLVKEWSELKSFKKLCEDDLK